MTIYSIGFSHPSSMLMLRITLLSLLCVTSLHAADPTPEDLLRQGLFEEEANRDYDKARERYLAVIELHDHQRALAATATFRLGEISRKKQDKDAATKAFRTVIERFPEQEELARLSQENLIAMGVQPNSSKPDSTQNTPTAAAPITAEDQEIRRLQDIARNSPDLLDGANTEGWTPLHVAVKNGWGRVISYLLEHQANPNARTIREQFTPLQIAAIYGQLNALTQLLAAKADINADGTLNDDLIKQLPPREAQAESLCGEWTPLELSILYNRRGIMLSLIKAGGELNRCKARISILNIDDLFMEGDRDLACTPLMIAIALHRDGIVQDLLSAGAKPNLLQDPPRLTPLALALVTAPSMLDLLIKAGAKVDTPVRDTKVTILHLASFYNRTDAASLLVKAGAAFDPKDQYGNTPLHYARSSAMVKFLLEQGANPNTQNIKGDTPIMALAKKKYYNEQDNEKELIDAFDNMLAGGAKVENPMALMKASDPMLRFNIRKTLIYPHLPQRPDCIVLSSDGINQNTFSNTDPYMETISHLFPKDKPLSVNELMLRFPANGGYSCLRILHRNKDSTFKVSVYDLTKPDFDPSISVPWGDIIDLEFVTKPGRTEFPPPPPTKVTIELEGIHYKKTINFPYDPWFSPNNNLSKEIISQSTLYPNQPPPIDQTGGAGLRYPNNIHKLYSNIAGITIPPCVDLTHIEISRNNETSITVLDLTSENRTFRLQDGDVISFKRSEPLHPERFSNLLITGDFKNNIYFSNDQMMLAIKSLNLTYDEAPNYDWSRFKVIHADKNQAPEIMNLSSLIEPTHDGNKIRAVAAELSAQITKRLQHGDIILLPLLPENADDSEIKKNDETRKALRSQIDFLIPN